MNEFELIDAILEELGPVGRGGLIGPGDDCAVIVPPAGECLVSSIDTLIGGVHFPEAAPGEAVGYRAAMVSLSDLAAMAAEPAQLLVALTLEETDQSWALAVARGMRSAVEEAGGRILGGNLARGARSITLSVHGFCPEASLLTRAGAAPGEGIFVTGPLGGAAAAVVRQRLDDLNDPLTRRYFHPRARIDAGLALRGCASSLIDVSDGLLQDLDHLCAASGTGADLSREAVPVFPGAVLDDALHGGDDYELLFTAPAPPLELDCVRIGEMSATPGVRLDGAVVAIKGYQHFL